MSNQQETPDKASDSMSQKIAAAMKTIETEIPSLQYSPAKQTENASSGKSNEFILLTAGKEELNQLFEIFKSNGIGAYWDTTGRGYWILAIQEPIIQEFSKHNTIRYKKSTEPVETLSELILYKLEKSKQDIESEINIYLGKNKLKIDSIEQLTKPSPPVDMGNHGHPFLRDPVEKWKEVSRRIKERKNRREIESSEEVNEATNRANDIDERISASEENIKSIAREQVIKDINFDYFEIDEYCDDKRTSYGTELIEAADKRKCLIALKQAAIKNQKLAEINKNTQSDEQGERFQMNDRDIPIKQAIIGPKIAHVLQTFEDPVNHTTQEQIMQPQGSLDELKSTDDNLNQVLFIKSEPGKEKIKDFLKANKIDYIYDYAELGYYCENTKSDNLKEFCETKQMVCIELPSECKTFSEFKIENIKENLTYVTDNIAKISAELGLQYKEAEDLLQQDCLKEPIKDKRCRELVFFINAYTNLLNAQVRFENSVLMNKSVTDSADKVKTAQSISELLDKHAANLAKYKDQDYLGLPQITIPELDNKLLGLRKLMMICAAPNTGKTSLTIQFGMDILSNNPDSCLLFVSLEMPIDDILIGMQSNLSCLTDREILLSRKYDARINGYRPLNEEELIFLAYANDTLASFGERIRIIDGETYPDLTIEQIMEHVDDIKQKTGLKHVAIAIDYLQVFPVPDDILANFKGPNDHDKWLISQMKKLRDYINKDTDRQVPLIVITEARKPSSSLVNQKPNMSDVMGSARVSYTPDCLMLLWPLNEAELINVWNKEIGLVIGIDDDDNKKTILKQFEVNEYTVLSLVISKGRNGMRRGSIHVIYYYAANRFATFASEKDFITKETRIAYPTAKTISEIEAIKEKIAADIAADKEKSKERKRKKEQNASDKPDSKSAAAGDTAKEDNDENDYEKEYE